MKVMFKKENPVKAVDNQSGARVYIYKIDDIMELYGTQCMARGYTSESAPSASGTLTWAIDQWGENELWYQSW